MAYQIADVSRLKPDGGIEFITDKGETLVLDAVTCKAIGCAGLPVGAHVRLTTRGGRIVAVTVISTGLSVAPSAIQQEQHETNSDRAEGVGGMNPCDGDLNDLLAGAENLAIKQLTRHLCRERRLVWYWRTPATPDQSIPAGARLPEELIQIFNPGDVQFERMYSHQVEALDALRNGQHVMVLTPTASGKTNCYNPAIFEKLIGDPAATALYVFPLNALMDDQRSKLNALAAGAKKLGHDISLQMLQGGMKEAQQDVIHGRLRPQIIATNPELLSFLLSNSDKPGMSRFLHNLRFVVLDEAHFYRGILGLHMAGIVRRLRLACAAYENHQPGPQFILSSATVGAPDELARRLTGINRFHYIEKEKSGRGQPQRHWLMLDPLAGDDKTVSTAHLHQAAEAMVDVLTTQTEKSLKAIVFVRSFRELNLTFDIAQRLLGDRRQPDLAKHIEKYNSAFITPAERRRIYANFKKPNGLRALISTNALEAGIDLGDLDVCILAGFPFHVMRMRQMAGRAGRKNEGAVIFIPRLDGVIDRFYADDPMRLITQREESFVIDADNPYIARRHLVEAAASLSGGVKREQFSLFGPHTDRMIKEAQQADVLQPTSSGWMARKQRNSLWAVGNIRGREQEPWAICSAPASERHCVNKNCLAAAVKSQGDSAEKCSHLVQLLDKQYVYREAHPGAVFESANGNFYRCEQLDARHRLIHATRLPDNTLTRTFPLEEIEVQFLDERDRRSLANGAQLVWGRAKVTHWYAGYGEYQRIPRRRCRKCDLTFASDVEQCTHCGQRTRPFMAQSDPEFFDFEQPYRIVLDTIACRLELPASLEPALKTIAHCPINHAGNKVREFVAGGKPFRNAQEVARLASVDQAASEIAFNYIQHWRPQAEAWQKDRERETQFPAVYGQCLCHALREKLPEAQALDAFAKLTGYPATADARHICRRCYEGVLLPAAHTLEHVVAHVYPMVALGDQQDIASVTYAIHPQTAMTTIVWFDQYEGGIGAAEKIFTQFKALIENTRDTMACDCHSDRGCPECVQMQGCDRSNDALSKVGATGLAHLLLGLAPFTPAQPFQAGARDKRKQEAETPHSERAAHNVPRPDQPEQTAGVDAFALVRVQSHVHDIVLAKAIEKRSEEIAGELPRVSIATLQQAYQHIRAQQRPAVWHFDPAWDAWHTLHILESASPGMARAAYRVIARAIHPDHYEGDKADATRMMQMVNTAWEKIKNTKS